MRRRSSAPSRRSRNWLTRWQPLAAAAGVAGLAFILVQSLPRDRDVAPSIQMEEPVSGPTAAPESIAQPARTPGERGECASLPQRLPALKCRTPATDSEHMKRTVPPPPPVIRPRPESAAGAMDEGSSAIGSAAMRATEVDQRQATVPEMSSQAASGAAAAPARERSNEAPLSAEDWAARVVALHASGNVTGAADTLRAFRVADPDADCIPAGIAPRLGADVE